MMAEHIPKSIAASGLIQSSDDEGGLQLGQVLAAIRRQTLLIIGVTTIVAVLAQIKGLSEKPVYSSGFEILTKAVTVESEVISSVPQTLTNRQQESTSSAATLDETKIKVLRSPSLLVPIVDQLKPKYPELTYDVLIQKLTIQTNGQDILTVSFSDEDVNLVKDALDKISKAYLNYSLEERQKDIRQGIAFVEEQLPELEKRVSTQQDKLQRFRQTYNLIDPEIQATQYSTQAGNLTQQQLETQTQLSETQLLYSELRQQLANQSNESAGSSALTESPRYQRLLDQLLEIDSKLAESSTLYLDTSPEIQVLREQRQNLLPLLQQEGVRVEQAMRSKIEELGSRNQAISQSIVDVNEKIKQLSAITREYNDIQRELQIATDNLNQFLAKREGLRIDAAQRQIPWQLLTPPGDPQPSAASLKRTLILGVILGLLLGVGTALLMDKLSNVIHTTQEVKGITKLPLLGVIPFNRALPKELPEETFVWLESSIEAVSPLQESMSAPFVESFRSLYTNIRLVSPDTPLRSIAISSATPGNGKSTVAMYLAQVAASMGQRVLLVDTDLRRPTLQRYLGLVSPKGLTDAVLEGLDSSDVIQKVPGEYNLFVLTAGTLPPDPTRILSSQAMQRLVAQLKKEYDLVIFDTAPLLGLADTHLLSTYTDGLLLVARLHQLKRSLLEQTLEALRITNTPAFGVVANASEEQIVSSYRTYGTAQIEDAQLNASLLENFNRRLKPLLQDTISKLKG
ncbi:MAG TPA: polysaccharide biosynthesis tyrosine autokinase [Crinalium sp.]|jgi:capsular exopolysaccharide synthesis family protein